MAKNVFILLSFEHRAKLQFYFKNPIFNIIETCFGMCILHQKSDQMLLVASFQVDKSGARLNFNLRFYDEYLELCELNNSISCSMISHNATLQFAKTVPCSLIHVI